MPPLKIKQTKKIMAENLPYLASPGSIKKCLEKISSKATPGKVTGDFVNTKLAIKGGNGRALVPFLKKIGFVASDGSPTDIYIKFRNSTHSKVAIAEAIKIGYRALYEANEYAHELDEKELKGLIVQVTGQSDDSKTVPLVQRTYNNLKSVADFEATIEQIEPETSPSVHIAAKNQHPHENHQRHNIKSSHVGMNLSYTINLNLPAISDISVFNAIFKSLKENLLDSDELE